MHYVVDAVNILFCTFSELFQNVPVAPTPLRIRICRFYLEIRDVLKTNGKPMILHGFCAHCRVVRRYFLLHRS